MPQALSTISSAIKGVSHVQAPFVERNRLMAEIGKNGIPVPLPALARQDFNNLTRWQPRSGPGNVEL